MILKFLIFTFFKNFSFFYRRRLAVQSKIEQTKQIRIELGNIQILKFDIIRLLNLKVINLLKQDYFTVEILEIKVDIKKLLTGKLQINHLKLSNCDAHHYKTDIKQTGQNKDGHLENKIDPQYILRSAYDKIYKNLSLKFQKTPNRIDIENFHLNYNDGEYHFQTCIIRNETYSSKVNKKIISVEISAITYNTSIGIDKSESKAANFVKIKKITLRSQLINNSDSHIYDLKASLVDANLDIKSLSDDVLERQNIGLSISAVKNTLGLDATTEIDYNGLTSQLIYKHSYKETDDLKIAFRLIELSLDKVLKSFPMLYNKELYQINSTGNFNFEFNIQNSFAMPPKWQSSINAHNYLKLDNFDKIDLRFLKKPFEHKIYDSRQQVHVINLDKSNTSYLALNEISENLKKVIICTEDPNFFNHKGIDAQGVLLALIINLRRKRFARGASTITMQLAKNLFLHNRKNICRKVEELIFTWFLEDVFKIGKDRMLEIYLNIVEFGQSIYGVNDAAYRYFGKSARSLTITESIVLSYIIPRPAFLEDALLMTSQQLKTNLKKHFNYFSNIMLDQNIISQSEYNDIQTNIVFSSPFGELNLIDGASL